MLLASLDELFNFWLPPQLGVVQYYVKEVFQFPPPLFDELGILVCGYPEVGFRELWEVEFLEQQIFVIVLEVFEPEVDYVDLVEEEVLDVEVVQDDVVRLKVEGNGDLELTVWLVFHPSYLNYNNPSESTPVLLIRVKLGSFSK